MGGDAKLLSTGRGPSRHILMLNFRPVSDNFFRGPRFWEEYRAPGTLEFAVMPEPTFKEKYALARRGDRKAQEQLVQGLQPRLLRFLERRMGAEARRMTEAEDLAQSTLLDLLERLDRFPEDLGETEFTAFALQLARWRLASLFRTRKSDVGASRAPGDAWVLPADTGIVTREDDRRWMSALISKLPPTLAEVLQAFHFRGESIALIAERMNLSRDAVKQRLSRGRHRLRDLMVDAWQSRGPST